MLKIILNGKNINYDVVQNLCVVDCWPSDFLQFVLHSLFNSISIVSKLVSRPSAPKPAAETRYGVALSPNKLCESPVTVPAPIVCTEK